MLRTHLVASIVVALTCWTARGNTDAKCEDSVPQCPSWANAGECDENPAYMHVECKKSCQLCTASGPCVNKRKDCAKYGAKGACTTKAVSMSKVCPETCNVCGPKDPCLANPDDRGVFGKSNDQEAFFRQLIANDSIHGGRVLSEDPWLVEFDNFLTVEEVDLALAQFEGGWQRSTAGGIVGMDSTNPTRTSEQVWCRVADCEKKTGMDTLVGRVESFTGISRERYEDTQILRYMPGQFYRPHWDFIQDQRLQPSGSRLLTFFVYLSDSTGAGTRFPKLNITVEARKGKAVMWSNVKVGSLYEQEDRTMHEGLPPVDAPKYSANVWIHQYDFRRYNLGDCLIAGRKLRYHGERKTPNSQANAGKKDEL